MVEKNYFNLSSITEMLGDEDVVNHLLKVFVESTPETLNEMNDGYNNQDSEKLARSAHKMKPSLDLLKIDILYDLVRTIDKKDKVDNMSNDQIDHAVKEMNRVLNHVFIQLKNKLGL